MQITVNGQSMQFEQSLTLQSLIEQLELAGKRMATMVNDQIVPRAERAVKQLADNDRVEIISMVGGG